MAEAFTTIKSELNKLLECSICTEVYDNPVFLPCLHTFCSKCIRGYVATFQTEGKQTSGYFNCPICRKLIEIPTGGVDNLPHNFFIANVKDTLISANTSFAKCRYCAVNGSDEKATWRCVDCAHDICQKCKGVHDIAHVHSKPHNVMHVNDWEKTGLMNKCQQIKEKCPKHKDEVFESFCIPCHKAICRDCHITSHEGHKWRQLSEVASANTHTIQGTVEHMRSIIQRNSEKIKEMQNCKDLLSKSHKYSIAEIVKQKSDIIKSVNDYFETLEQQLSKTIADSEQSIDETLKKLQTETDTLNSYIVVGEGHCRFGRGGEMIDTCELLSQVLRTQQKATFDIEEIKKKLQISKHKPGKSKTGKDMLGYCERMNLVHNEDGEDDQPGAAAPPPVGKIRNQLELMSSFLTATSVYSLCIASNDDIITSDNQSALVYDSKGDGRCELSAPPRVKTWKPTGVTSDEATVIVSNYASVRDGGRLYVYSVYGHFTGRVIRVGDKPWRAAVTGDGHIAVLVRDKRNNIIVKIYELESGKLINSTRQRMSQKGYNIKYGSDIAVSRLSLDVIVSHGGGVTAFSSPDLTLRWQYRCQAGAQGELCDPLVVCVDNSGAVFVIDYAMRRVMVLTEDGRYVTHLDTAAYMNAGPYALTLNNHQQLVMSGYNKDSLPCVFTMEYLH